MDWHVYFEELAESNDSTPEQALVCAAFERVVRDLGLIGSEKEVTYRNLRDACDYVFDEPSGDSPWTLRWLLQKMNGIGEPEDIIRHLREYVLDYWTVARVKKMFCEV